MTPEQLAELQNQRDAFVDVEGYADDGADASVWDDLDVVVDGCMDLPISHAGGEFSDMVNCVKEEKRYVQLQ